MLKIEGQLGLPLRGPAGAASAQDAAWHLTVLRREWPLVAFVTACCLLAGLVYAATAQPLFTASASIMIDTRKNQLLQNQQVVGDQQLDTSGVESQVEILKSESVALSVIRELKLADDPAFAAGGSLIGSLLSAFKDDTRSDRDRERTIVSAFSRMLQVRRVGLTYVIQIDFTSSSPARSAEIANAIADAYMVNELDARYQATRRASRWLQDRIKELREQASAAERQVQQFRADNGIIDTGRGLLSEQQLADVNAQLVTARAATAEAKARLDRITDVARGDLPDATVTDALKNDVITRLRAQYLDLSARQTDWSARYGANHNAAINLRNQMAEIRRSIVDELRRIGETYKSEYEIARAREQSLQASLATLVSEAGVTGQAQVKLKELESSSQTARNLYDSFLQRFMEATQQQTFPVSDARLITAASPPLQKSAPRTSLIVAGASVLGLLLGCSAAFARERLDDAFRTGQQVEALTQVECLGILPVVGADAKAAPDGPADATASRGVMRFVADEPFSRFTEGLRNVKVAADISNLTREMRVIGVVSAVPNEGKTTIASNLALLIAQTGNRVLLVDGDLRNPALTQALVPDAGTGLIDVLSGRRSLAEAVVADGGLDVLPAVLDGRVSHTAELISSRGMAELIEAARRTYAYIVIDLPPVIPVVDVRAASHLIDGFVGVVEWGRTSRDVVLEALTANEVMRERMIGIVLNKANVAALARLEAYKGRYSNSYYRPSGAAA